MTRKSFYIRSAMIMIVLTPGLILLQLLQQETVVETPAVIATQQHYHIEPVHSVRLPNSIAI